MEAKFKKGDVIKVDNPELPSHLMYVLEVTEKGYKVALITAITIVDFDDEDMLVKVKE